MLKPLAWSVSLVACLAWAQGETLPPGAVRLPAGHEAWKAGTPPFPATMQVAVLEGDPQGTGQFTVRVKLPAKTVLARHTHPVDERTTVISGVVWVGFEGAPDQAKGTKLGAGSFYLNPKGVPHWIMVEQDAVLQISTTGPWGVGKAPSP